MIHNNIHLSLLKLQILIKTKHENNRESGEYKIVWQKISSSYRLHEDKQV